MTGEPRSIADEIAKYWLGTRHNNFTPAAFSASASLKRRTFRKRLRTRRTRARLPVSPRYCCTRAALQREATSVQATRRTYSERFETRRLATSRREELSTTT